MKKSKTEKACGKFLKNPYRVQFDSSSCLKAIFLVVFYFSFYSLIYNHNTSVG